MTKTPVQFWNVQSLRGTLFSHSFQLSYCASSMLGTSLCLSLVAAGVWLPAASARPVMRVQRNVYAAPTQPIPGQPIPTQIITFPPVLPFHGSVYRPVQPIVQSGSGVGLSVQIGTPTYYPSGVYPSGVYPSGVYPSGYTYRQPGFSPPQGSVNNSVLINPTVINGSIRNSTLVYPTIVTTPYDPATSYPSQQYPTLSYPTPYDDVRTVIPTTRPEPQVVIDPQYGVRYQSPPYGSERQVVIDPQYGVRYSNPSGY